MAEEVLLVQNGQYSALDVLFKFNDGMLIEADFNEAGVAFANQYYEPKTAFANKYAFFMGLSILRQIIKR